MRKIFTLILILISQISSGQNSEIADLWKLYTSQDYKLAIEKAKPLIEENPNNVDLNLLMGRSFTELSDFKKAIPYLDLVVKNDIYNSWQKAWALSYLGTCYFMLQDSINSKTFLEDCIRLNATKNVTNDAYGKTLIFGFNEFYKNWKIIETENFRFHFQNMPREEIEKYTSLREAAYKKINSFFESVLPKKTDFYVWASREDALNILRSNLGFASPDFCIVHTHYQQTIGHEMTHIISNYTSEIKTKTRFINEGTAVCFDLSNSDDLSKVKEWTVVNNNRISIKDFWANGEKYGEEILYPLSGLFVKELIDKFGREKFLEFFKNQTYENANHVFGNKLDILIGDFEKKINT
jgi:tetratricopeptide (TPR) repeat protein